MWSAENYLNTSCYKVLAYDPNDEIIGFMASLTNGISKQFASNTFLPQKRYGNGDHSMFSNFYGFWRRTFFMTEYVVTKVTQLWLPIMK